MFAAFQAGAWRALAGRFAPDVVIGASAGALNAWMVAGRVDPEELPALVDAGRAVGGAAAAVAAAVERWDPGRDGD
jgi:predicted acylesterase/phospholipase RssA